MASGLIWHWRRDCGERGEPFEVLCDGGEKELVSGTGYAPETEPLEAHVALEMRKQHLHLLTFVAGLLEGGRADERAPCRELLR